MARGTGVDSPFWLDLKRILGAAAIVVAIVSFAAILNAVSQSVFGEAGVKAWVTGDHAILTGWLTGASSVATLVIAFMAWYAIRFARTQALEANRARIATLYATVHSMWNDREFTASRELIRSLRRAFAAEFPEHKSADAFLPQYMATRLLKMRDENPTAYNEHTKCLDILEYFGAACRAEIMDWRMLMEMYGGQVTAMSKYLTEFCLQLQVKLDGGEYGHASAVYANALWLFEQNASYEPFQFKVAESRLNR